MDDRERTTSKRRLDQSCQNKQVSDVWNPEDLAPFLLIQKSYRSHTQEIGRSKTSVASTRAFPYDPHLPAATRNPIRTTPPGLIQVSIAAHTKSACPYDPIKGSMERCVLMTTGRKHSPNDHKIPWSHRSFLPLFFWMLPPENAKQQMHPAAILFLPGHGSNLMKMQTWRSAMNEKISCRKKHYGRSLHGSPILPVKTGNRNLIFAFCIMEV